MSTKPMSSAPVLNPDEPVLFCPACGYDLRASKGGRCPECGLAIDHASLMVSAFPWAHRGEMGRVRAYVRTVWQVLVGSRALNYEAAKPQDPGDARSFARVTGILLAITFLAPLVAMVLQEDGLGFLAVPPIDFFALGGARIPNAAQDVVVPWAAGVTLWPMVALCPVLLAFYLARAARPMFRRTAPTPVLAERAVAIALYAAAPLVLLLAAQLVFLGVVLLDRVFKVMQVVPELPLICVVVAALMAVIGVVATLVRTGQWLARVRHGGTPTAVAGAAGLVGLWLAGVIVLLGLLPWCVGFLWLVVDSLR